VCDNYVAPTRRWGESGVHKDVLGHVQGASVGILARRSAAMIPEVEPFDQVLFVGLERPVMVAVEDMLDPISVPAQVVKPALEVSGFGRIPSLPHIAGDHGPRKRVVLRGMLP
jgi:hypothetical protein